MNKYRLHEIETLLELYSADPFVFRPTDLYRLDQTFREHLESYNIYLLGTRPRISIHLPSLGLDLSGQIVEGVFNVHLEDEIVQVPFTYEHKLELPITALGGHEYPYDNLRLILNNEIAVQLGIHEIILLSSTHIQPYSDIKIEYIGRSIGEKNRSDAIERLIGKTGKRGHGDLQRILTDLGCRPDKEVYILLYDFGYHRMVAFGGGLGPEPVIPYGDVPNRMDDMINSTLPRRNKIDLIEASLIRYFQPKYNEKYKEAFPKANHTILNNLFKNDVTSLAVSLSTNEHGIRVFSDKISPCDSHLAMYSIVKDKNRASFLDLSEIVLR